MTDKMTSDSDSSVTRSLHPSPNATQLSRLINGLESLPLELIIDILEYVMSDDDLYPCLLSTFLSPEYLSPCRRAPVVDGNRGLEDKSSQPTAVHSPFCCLVMSNPTPSGLFPWLRQCVDKVPERITPFHPPQTQHRNNWLLIQHLAPGIVRRTAFKTFFRTKWFAITSREERILSIARTRGLEIPFALRCFIRMVRNIFCPIFKNDFWRQVPYFVSLENPIIFVFDGLQHIRLWHQPVNDSHGETLAEPSAYLELTSTKYMPMRVRICRWATTSVSSGTPRRLPMKSSSRDLKVQLHLILPKDLDAEDVSYLRLGRLSHFYPQPTGS